MNLELIETVDRLFCCEFLCKFIEYSSFFRANFYIIIAIFVDLIVNILFIYILSLFSLLITINIFL